MQPTNRLKLHSRGMFEFKNDMHRVELQRYFDVGAVGISQPLEVTDEQLDGMINSACIILNGFPIAFPLCKIY